MLEPPLRRSTKKSPNLKCANAALMEDDGPKAPTSFIDASKRKEWIEAIKEVIEALRQNETWELVPKPKKVCPITCKWIYKLKIQPDGSIERHKARVVARGYSQRYGLDYDETFSPVAKITTVRRLLAFAATKSWKLCQIDVKNAFLHGELDRSIYIKQPEGFRSKAHPDYMCKVKIALYGIKQAPRAWYAKIAVFLVQSGYSITPSNSSLFLKYSGGKLSVVLIYVNDLIITADHEKEINEIRANISVQF